MTTKKGDKVSPKISELLEELTKLEQMIASPDQDIEDAIIAYGKSKVLVRTLIERLSHVETQLTELEANGKV